MRPNSAIDVDTAWPMPWIELAGTTNRLSMLVNATTVPSVVGEPPWVSSMPAIQYASAGTIVNAAPRVASRQRPASTAARSNFEISADRAANRRCISPPRPMVFDSNTPGTDSVSSTVDVNAAMLRWRLRAICRRWPPSRNVTRR